MKKLALLMFAILILGCGTETPMVEEPEPVIEEPPPVVMEDEPIGHPLVAKGTVKHGEMNVDPEPLNRDGFLFVFKEPVYRHSVTVQEKDGTYLLWDSHEAHRWGKTEHVFIWPIHGVNAGAFKYDTEYEIVIYTENFDCNTLKIVIQFRTKPRRSVIEEPEPVIQKRIPAVPSGERFRLDIIEPQLVAADVPFRGQNVDPEPLNANGIQFEFNHAIKKYKIDLRLKGGASLGWLPHGLANNENIGKRIQIMPGEGAPLLEFDTAYEVDIFVMDFFCWPGNFQMVFHTKPKP